MRYSIRPAIPADAVLLPDIERSAGTLFRSDPDLAWIADDAVQSVERHIQLISSGAAWVAAAEQGVLVGFLNGEMMGAAFHVWEMSVHADHQRRGLGAMLIEAARRHASASGCTSLTLTTFRDVAWNDAFYLRLGFRRLEEADLSEALRSILAEEAASGLPAERRCAMVCPIDPLSASPGS